MTGRLGQFLLAQPLSTSRGAALGVRLLFVLGEIGGCSFAEIYRGE